MFTKSLSTPVVNISALAPQVKQAVMVADQVNANSGKVDVSNGQVIELVPTPTFTKVNVSNPNNANSLDGAMVYIFNAGVTGLKNSISDNVYPDGAVLADKVAVTYDDGFAGRYIDKLISTLALGRGLMCEELTIIGKSAGVQSDDAILALNAAIQSYNATRGDAVPVNLDLSEGIRNTAYKAGFVTLKLAFWINQLSQFTFPIPKNYSYEFKFKWAGSK
jgi:hypothetical protein